MQDLENSRIAELLRENNRLLKKLAGEGPIDLSVLSKEEQEKLVELKIRDTPLEAVVAYDEANLEPVRRAEKEKREMNRYKES